MPERNFEWYKTLLKQIIADDMNLLQNQEQAYAVLWEMKQKLGFENVDIRNFAMKASKYVHEMANFEYQRTGQEEFKELYWKLMLLEAQSYQVDSALMYLEKNRVPKERFYEPRRKVFTKYGITNALQDLVDDKIDILSVSLPPGTGKALSDDTPILTSEGWKNHGDLLVGDKVYGIDGTFKRVINVFPKTTTDCLVTFTNGERLQCHENHEWTVIDRHKGREGIIETKELFSPVIETGTPGKRGHRYCYMLPLKKPFVGEHKELPIKPYTFGVWLGDGTNKNPTICGSKEDIEIEMKSICAEGYGAAWKTTHKTTLAEYRGIKGLRFDLQKCGMCHSRRTEEKYIPEIYFSASKEQRLELLAGLLDTDGTLSKKERKYHFSTTGEKLKDGFIKLISTFGWRCSISEEEPGVHGSGVIGRKKVYTIGFSPTEYIPCKLGRKQLFEFSNQRRIAIKSVERVEPKQGNCIQVEDGIYCAGKTMLPTHNSTIEVFFLALVGGWFPNDFNLSSAHSSILTRSLYDGVAEIIDDPVEYTWHEIFPNVAEERRNTKETTMNLERPGRFKTWTFRSIDGSLTGATRCNRFLTADDLVSGIEEALNKTRLETLWTKVVNDLRSRRLDGCKEIYFATRWSVHDPIGKIYQKYEGNPRARFIAVPALDENGESNFQYTVNGFSTEYFLDQKELMDDISFDCLYMQKPIEREGLLFPSAELRRFFLSKDQVPDNRNDYTIIPEREPDAIWGVCDTKDKGTDYESLPIAYQYGQDFYIPAVVFDDSTDYNALDKKTAEILIEHQPHKVRFESNQAGNRIAKNIEDMIEGLCRTIIETKYTEANKETKILVNSDYIKKHFLFLEPSLYAPKSDYGKFMANVVGYTTKGKVPHDDGPDSLAMMAEYVHNPFKRRQAVIINSPI